MVAAPLVLASCHFSNGDYGPAGAGGGTTSSASSGPIGANTTAPDAKLLGGSAAPKTASTYDGAGFPIPTYPPVPCPRATCLNGSPLEPVEISWRNSPYGPILTTASGETLYLRLGDGFRESGCHGICLRAFPPLLTNGAPQAAPGLLAADVGDLTASNGKEQASYGGHPLYTYRGDTKPGQYGAEGKGGIWYVVSITGLPVKAPVHSGTSSSSATTSTSNG
ncbi:secreted repeat of unknown function [Acidimicrobium ferrooxidans DSM 10331]|uniref:Lipoprotein n=1 Tax=Acidimicrobium ferrooxidans (strain DSM 10331 / JCM 15462 / NBRC 103882 / ICP) TaxID=525909 RepID=C7M1H6_ACIFD|nr:secreted repeat of unknown function [Acidimicrobium ferrooxidans DSM 10331]